jgi:hypothetical protein
MWIDERKLRKNKAKYDHGDTENTERPGMVNHPFFSALSVSPWFISAAVKTMQRA